MTAGYVCDVCHRPAALTAHSDEHGARLDLCPLCPAPEGYTLDASGSWCSRCESGVPALGSDECAECLGVR